MKFSKMHGIGNDYIYVNCLKEPLQQPQEVAKFVSDRHFGIGSDGLILIQPSGSEKADFEMAMYNADGSRGEMCGNAIRCVAKYVYDRHLTDQTSIRIETLAGIKEADLTVADGKAVLVRVNMGKPQLEPERIPVRYPQPAAASGQDSPQRHQIVDCAVSVGGKEYKMTCVSMGNPHCVIFTDEVEGLDLEKTGRSLSVTAAFRTASIRNLQKCWTGIRYKCAYGKEVPVRRWLAEQAPARLPWPVY